MGECVDRCGLVALNYKAYGRLRELDFWPLERQGTYGLLFDTDIGRITATLQVNDEISLSHVTRILHASA